MGFSCLRFNFRGVGKSEGTYDQGVGELADTSALDYLQSNVLMLGLAGLLDFPLELGLVCKS